MNSVILVIFTCCCVIVNGFTVYDRRKPQDDLNPQLWASHSEAFNHPLEFHQHKPTQAVAALPQLLEENPRAEGVFKTLSSLPILNLKFNGTKR
ncbi:unnamed protein product [Bursaphelenchus okinawaensis]|uniref:Uncharacterized protein n=1 Tax=Bursaphelenchus okinawaensis TaxID=465554 RepID=A0A811LR70_9BILA|nr:unnamed protein product [Bursaphelenchus okinawaensis]CAG9127103.1 unnamed protein product [Bursaphelenchus okinawaensis]